MKQKLLIALLFITIQGFAQTDDNGNPIFNSVATGEEAVNDFTLVSNYYTLKNNIENKNSSVYISENPALNEVSIAAISLPSDFFLVTKGRNVISMIMMVNQPSKKFIVVNPATREKSEFACSIKGDITENRAIEILKENYDANAKIDGDKLYFNEQKLKIISNATIKKSVLELIRKQKLSAGNTASLKLLSKEDLRKIVLAESKEGGKLDFFTEIKGHEYDGIEIKPGVITTRIGIALYHWGRANFELGVNTLEDALEFWSEFKGREANQREKDYIKRGFNREFEK